MGREGGRVARAGRLISTIDGDRLTLGVEVRRPHLVWSEGDPESTAIRVDAFSTCDAAELWTARKDAAERITVNGGLDERLLARLDEPGSKVDLYIVSRDYTVTQQQYEPGAAWAACPPKEP